MNTDGKLETAKPPACGGTGGRDFVLTRGKLTDAAPVFTVVRVKGS